METQNFGLHTHVNAHVHIHMNSLKNHTHTYTHFYSQKLPDIIILENAMQL